MAGRRDPIAPIAVRLRISDQEEVLARSNVVLLVFFAVLTGARVAGVWGAIFGVPIVAVLTTMTSFYRANQEERVARLQEHLPGQELMSVDATPPEAPDESPGEALISSGKGVARS